MEGKRTAMEVGAGQRPGRRPTCNDRELAESVLRAALSDGYAVVGHPVRVYRCVGGAEIEAVPRYESETVLDLIERDVLRVGGWHEYTCGEFGGRGRSVVAPKQTCTLLNRWAALKWDGR